MRSFTRVERDVLRVLLCLPPNRPTVKRILGGDPTLSPARVDALKALRADGVVVHDPDGLVFGEDPTREPSSVAPDWVPRLLCFGGPLSVTVAELTARDWAVFAAESLKGLSAYTVGGLCRHGWPAWEPKTPGGPGVPQYMASSVVLLDTLKWQLHAREQEAGRLRRELAWAEQSIAELTALRQAVLDKAAGTSGAASPSAPAQEPA